MNIISTIQARTNSSRLPGKVLMKVEGKEILKWQVDRIKLSRCIDDIVIATTNEKCDDQIIEFCERERIKYYRGSENNVLERVAQTINEFQIDVHVECFGDSPLVDPSIIDEFVNFFMNNQEKYDFISNTIEHTYPAGLEVIVYKGSTLNKVNDILEKNDPLREHAGYNITRFPEKFKIYSYKAPPHFRKKEISLEIDEKKDLDLFSAIIKNFTKQNKEFFSATEILEFLNFNPELSKINSDVKRRWKDLQR